VRSLWVAVCVVFFGFVPRAGADPDVAPAAEPAARPTRLSIRIDTPSPGAVVASAEPSCMVVGRVLFDGAELDPFDLVLAIDRSKSTDAPTGADIDADGYVGQAPGGRIGDRASDDRGDSVLAAEVVAAHTLLDQLDSRTTRVAIVAFSGRADSETPDAETLAPLSFDYAAARQALDSLLVKWPSGRTNMAAALHLSTAELLGLGERSERRADTRRAILLMTDGQPTLPVPFSPEANGEATFQAARLAARAGIRVDTFAIGSEANDDARVLQGVAALTQGTFTPVLEPRALVSTFEALRWARVERIEARNQTTGRAAEALVVEPDGRFSAMLPLEPGLNRLEIRAHGAHRRSTVREVEVELLPAGHVAEPDPRWIAERTRLLEQKLLELQRRQLHVEMSRVRERDRELEIDAAGEPASPRTDRPRRALEIAIEEAPAAPAAP